MPVFFANNILNHLGHSFREQKPIQNELARPTGYWDLDVFNEDEA